ncbi:MAG TPA: NUDIX hydrolase [Bacillota bacterium]|nr:NUDIX hydrolase [Bacillota bacterium]
MARELVQKPVKIREKTITFTFLSTKDAVVVLPIKPDGRVILVKQIRPAVDEWLLELPAGGIEKGEDPLAAAMRELTEETGYEADDMQQMVSFFPSPGTSTEKMYLFSARVSSQKEQHLDEGEDIQVEEYSLSEAWDLVKSGAIKDGKTILGLSLLQQSTR